jgi:hypothetical protein
MRPQRRNGTGLALPKWLGPRIAQENEVRASERATATGVGGEPATAASGIDDEIRMYVQPDSPFSLLSSLVSSKHSVTQSHIPLSDLTASLPLTSALKSSPRLVLVDAAQLKVMGRQLCCCAAHTSLPNPQRRPTIIACAVRFMSHEYLFFVCFQ